MYSLNLGVKGLSLPLYLHYTNITCDRHRIIEVSLKKWSILVSLKTICITKIEIQTETLESTVEKSCVTHTKLACLYNPPAVYDENY